MKRNQENITNANANAAALATTVTIGGLTVNDTLDFSKVHNAALKQEVEGMAQYHAAIVHAAASAVDAQRPIAMSLYRVGASKLYEKDFKTMKEYVAAIGLCVSESQISQYRTAGKVYCDSDAPDALKALSVSLLGALGKAINNDGFRKRLYDAVSNGTFNDFSQSKCAEWIKANCTSTPANDAETETDTDSVTEPDTSTDADSKSKSKGKIVKSNMVFTNSVYGKSPELNEDWLPRAMFISEWIKAAEETKDETGFVKAVEAETFTDESGRAVVIQVYMYTTFAEVHTLREYTDRDRKRDYEKIELERKRNEASAVKTLVLKIAREEQLTDTERALAIQLGLLDEVDESTAE